MVAWQTGTARLLAGRKSGPVFLTDRRAEPVDADADERALMWAGTGFPLVGRSITGDS